MRLDGIALRGLLRFDAPIALDLNELPAGLIAVLGENGAGKTTLLEAPFASLYRHLPSRDRDLVDYANGRDAFIESRWSLGGVAIRARINLDASKRHSDAVLEVDGRPVNDGKVSTFDAAVAERFPSAEVLLASAMAAQNRAGSFVELDRKGRRDLFAELLGLAQLERLAERARRAVALYGAHLASLAAARAALASQADPGVRASLEANRAAAVAELAGRREELADVDVRLQGLEAAHADRVAQAAGAEAARERLAAAERRLELAQATVGALQAEAVRAEQVLAMSLTTEGQNADLVRRALGERIAAAEALLARRPALAEAQAEAERLRARLVALRADLDLARANQDRLSAEVSTHRVAEAQLDAAVGRRRSALEQAGLLATVPCGGKAPYADCSLLAAAQAAQATLPDLEAEVLRLASAPLALEAAEQELAVARAAVFGLARDRDLAQAALEALAEPLALAGKLAAAEARLVEAQADLAGLEARTAKRLEGLQAAAASAAAERAARRHDAQAELEAARAAMVGAREAALSTDDARVALEASLEQLRQWRPRRDQLVARVAALEVSLTGLEAADRAWSAAAARLVTIDAAVAEAQAASGRWATLSRALGRDGLPVLEIDAAGPTVAAYANELLAVCYGGRFTVDLVTQVPTADGRGQKEVFELRVIDNERGGADRDLGDLSGGEQILVDEALKNALVLFVNERHAGAVQTCWRDETTGPLSTALAERYLLMLRRVQQLGGFRHILFVSHSPVAAALADAQVVLADGALSVRRPPFEVAR